MVYLCNSLAAQLFINSQVHAQQVSLWGALMKFDVAFDKRLSTQKRASSQDSKVALINAIN